MPVAKSYQQLEQLCEPYERNCRKYIKVRLTSGAEKEVRWYNEVEYSRMYPEEKPTTERLRSIKEVLGFEKGYITIFKGDTAAVEDWLRDCSVTRYHKAWGWYIVSTDEVPQLPNEISAVRLLWEDISQPDGSLKPESAISKEVEKLIYEPSTSEYLGEVGERITIKAKVVKAIPLEDHFGTKTFHIFKTPEGNIATWTTGAKTLEVGEDYEIRGSIKSLNEYKGTKQTCLTRCKGEKIWA